MYQFQMFLKDQDLIPNGYGVMSSQSWGFQTVRALDLAKFAKCWKCWFADFVSLIQAC